MSEIVGEVEVLVRPSTAGFVEAATPGVQKAGATLGGLFAKAFAITGIAYGVKEAFDTVTSHQAAFDVLTRVVTNAGAANDIYGTSIESLLEKEARLKGFSDEDLASAFQRLVSVTHNSAAAFKLVGEAEDLARFRHIDLASAALALAKAQQGSATALQRYGIVVPKVTSDTDALKAKYTQLVESGVKLDATQKAQYESALRIAAAHDKQATSIGALQEVEARVGGSASTFAGTAAGQVARAEQDFHQFEVAFLTNFLPTISSGAEALGHLFTAGAGFADRVGGGAHALELLALAVGGYKLAGLLAATATAETAVGDAAATAAPEVDALAAGLSKLKLIGAIAIPILVTYEIQKHDKSLNQQASDLYHNLGTVLHENIPSGHDLLKLAIGDPGRAGVLGNAIYSALGEKAAPAGAKAGASWFGAYGAEIKRNLALQTLPSGIQDFFHVFSDLPKVISGQLDSDKTLAVAKAGNAAAKRLMQSLRDGIKNDQEDLDLIKSNLADAITQGVQAVDNAVQQAKQNLNQIGQSLATAAASVIDTPLALAQAALSRRGDEITVMFDRQLAALQRRSNQLTTESDRLNLQESKTTLRNLGREILLPGGHPLSADPTRAIAQLEALEKRTKSPALEKFIEQYRQSAIGVQQAEVGIRTQVINARKAVLETGVQIKSDALKLTQDTAEAQKRIITRQIANLTDAFNQGPQTAAAAAALQKRVVGVLAAHGITRAKALQVLGPAGADLFSGDVTGLLRQAQALVAGPHRAGTGLVPTITRPLDTLNQTTKQIATLQKERDQKQLDETKKQTKLLTTLANQRKAAAFITSLTGNKGAASKTQKDLTGVGG